MFYKDKPHVEGGPLYIPLHPLGLIGSILKPFSNHVFNKLRMGARLGGSKQCGPSRLRTIFLNSEIDYCKKCPSVLGLLECLHPIQWYK
jgi:hypothetical protein